MRRAPAGEVVGTGGRAPADAAALDRLADRLEGRGAPARLRGDDERAQVTAVLDDLMAPYIADGMSRVQAMRAVMDARA